MVLILDNANVCKSGGKSMKKNDEGTTHWQDCWKVHRDCAASMIERQKLIIEQLAGQLEAENERAQRLGKHCSWLMYKIDEAFDLLCPEGSGDWIERAEQVVVEVKKIKGI